MKPVLLICMIAACTMCGYSLSGAAARRCMLLEELLRSLRTLRIQILHLLEPLPAALDHTGFPLFCKTAERLNESESAKDAWHAVMKFECAKGRQADCMNERDISALDKLFEQLGVSGCEAQNEAISGCILYIEETLTEAKEHRSQIGRLYTSIGFLAGLGAAIVLI